LDGARFVPTRNGTPDLDAMELFQADWFGHPLRALLLAAIVIEVDPCVEL